MTDNNKPYVVHSVCLANAILFVSGITFQKRQNEYNGKTVYTFLDSPKLREVITELNSMKKQFNN